MTVDDFINEWQNDSPTVVAHTSGSTGTPKEILLSKADMIASAKMTNAFFGITETSRLLLCLSPDYIAGKMMIVRALTAGAELEVERPSNNVLADYDGEPFDLVAVVPSQALSLVENPSRLKYINSLIIGGGVVPESLRKSLISLGVNAYSTYGMTETCSHIALQKIDATGSPYEVLPPTTVSIDDRGCLVAELPQFSVEKVVTNDIIELISSTQFRWRGRYDNVINTGGLKVFPEEVEAKIAPLVESRYYIASRPSDKWGEEIVLVLERESISADEEAKLLQILKSALLPHQVPKAVICKYPFDETSTGKIKRTL